ncbi:craniofacial development protein 1 [Aplysia californica]|uniref:Craniofacial development protein 1 n=1 Tax=Aplysia californica TaxID=6500 RepID=A0ABM0K6I0_APLCA|nr:craniofacial development protein 1 [Aplysia californica]
MSDEEDYNSEEDVDYVPTDGEQVSEEENSGDEEDLSLLNDGDESQGNKVAGKRKKTGKKKNAIESRKRRGGIKLDANESKDTTGEQQNGAEEDDEKEKSRKKELAEEIAREEEEKRKEKEKKRADDLWSSFMSDVKTVPSKKSTSGSGLGGLSAQVSSTKEETSKVQPAEADKGGKVTITKVFDFAGEEVKITKEVDANSKEAKAEQKKQEKESQEQLQKLNPAPCSSIQAATVGLGVKRPAVGGLGSVLNKINKKSKMGTLEKSKIDWDSFKKKEGIDEDLKIHNKGKQGYTERMAFLSRADQRQYEIERDLRLGSSSKR